MDIPHYANGTVGRLEVDPSFLGDKVKTKTLRAAIVMYEANRRVGTHDTKTRAEVARSKKSLFKQKGLGRARVKHPQVAQCRGGGTAHGPHPRDYSWRMPKKALKVALRAALLSKFKDEQVVMADSFGLNAPKTSQLAKELEKLGVARSCLIVDVAPAKELVLSARNLGKVRVMPVSQLCAHDVVAHQHLVLTPAAFETMKEALGDGQ